MGLDIYAGTLTRYYAQNWKTAVQQWAEENGYQFSKLTPSGQPIRENRPDPSEVQQDMEAWRDAVTKAVSQEGCLQPSWAEDNEKPYYTDKPDWDAFGALLLYAACRAYQEPVPPTVKKGWSFHEHPTVLRFAGEIERKWSLFSDTELWLPIDDFLLLECQNPVGAEGIVSTTKCLRAELEKINEIGWCASEAEIIGWSDSEGYPTDGQVENGEIIHLGTETEYNTDSLAKFAFSMFYQAVLFSEENNVPILLDY